MTMITQSYTQRRAAADARIGASIIEARRHLFVALDTWADVHTGSAQRAVREALAEIGRLEHQPAD